MPWHCSMRSRILASLHFPIPVTCSRLPIEKRSLAEHLPKIVLGHGKITFIMDFLSLFLLFFFFQIIKKNLAIFFDHNSHVLCALHLYSSHSALLHQDFRPSPFFPSSSTFPFSVFSFLRSKETTCYILAPTTLLSYSLLMEVKLCCHGHKHLTSHA